MSEVETDSLQKLQDQAKKHRWGPSSTKDIGQTIKRRARKCLDCGIHKVEIYNHRGFVKSYYLSPDAIAMRGYEPCDGTLRKSEVATVPEVPKSMEDIVADLCGKVTFAHAQVERLRKRLDVELESLARTGSQLAKEQCAEAELRAQLRKALRRQLQPNKKAPELPDAAEAQS